ncbi:hypothetical protein BC351_14560 [Paenibacillus ferrarius]|uniref:Antitoxin YwqK n=2 Tax=Paenibacillus ferrarius TaxID=1469647 RepID=A0A1V4H6E9_9BACL|nr:hypothetical protein BC351_14560 [Paenibacillus ferrarius]
MLGSNYQKSILTIDEVFLTGIEFTDDVCFSGESGQEVYDKPIEEGGKPITGLVYERYRNGNLAYYSYYKNGIAEGDYVNFFENGKVESFREMCRGVLFGQSLSWFDNGILKSMASYKYGFKIIYREWNIGGELVNEMLEPNDFEKSMIEKYDKWNMQTEN